MYFDYVRANRADLLTISSLFFAFFLGSLLFKADFPIFGRPFSRLPSIFKSIWGICYRNRYKAKNRRINFFTLNLNFVSFLASLRTEVYNFREQRDLS
ncbi:hypothetical protein BpHYR1_020632 [Brachionus plicatilis]|uniref:Uncharacterized protein n=1 Tax=Brachionus plicatilis TaxID=10195 RepID=A0A3M7RSG0_BRAPC|nr:hypothetical protein BpHYR1_020632 [Brachionus plicatilis]